MKLTADRAFADPEKAARKLIELANAVEAYMDQRILIELINGAFLSTGGSPAEYKVGLDLAIAKGWLWPHESGTQAGAELFAYQASHVQPLVDHWAGKWTLRGAYLHNGPELPTAPA